MTTDVLAPAEGVEGGQRGRHRRGRRRGAIVAVYTAAALVATGGIGYAFWSASGSGPGAAKATTATALTVVAGTADPQLYPGATGDVFFSVTNPNLYNVEVNAATASSVTGTSDDTNCPATNFTLNAGSVTAVTINAGLTGTVKVTNGITMVSTAPNACQGVTVTVSGSVSGTQV
jgi:hypothetical protein